MVITSRSNSKYKEIKRLIASAKERKAAGLFVVEGSRACAEVPEDLLDTLCVSESYARSVFAKDAVIFSDEIFRSLSDTVNPQGVLAVAKQPSYSLEEMIDKASRETLFLILDDIRDPGNLGTIVRTAEGAGAAGVILSPGCADIFSPKVIRSTMGSIFRVPFVSGDLKDALTELKKKGVLIYALAPRADTYYNEEKYKGRCAFIIGNEARGISEEAMNLADKKIKIPMAGQVESLNAAISAAIIMYGYKKWT